MFGTSVITTTKTTDDPVELRLIYGPQAIFSRVGEYNLIHLDRPEPAEIERRVAGFDPDELFEDDCPLCRMMRGQRVDVVFVGESENLDN